MKAIFKIFSSAAIIGGVVAVAGCTKNFEDYNTDQYALRAESPSLVIPSMIETMMYVQQNSSQMADQMVGSLGGYFTNVNRWQGANFDTFNVSDGWNTSVYDQAFQAIYSNYFKVEDLTDGEGHWFAFAKLVKAASMMRVTDCYGPIPYSQVQDGEMYVPYDSGEDVYRNIIDDLLSAADVLYQYSAQVGASPIGTSDAIYSGNYAYWAKLGVSLAMRAAMRAGFEDDFVRAMESECGYITSNSENAMVDPKTQGNPYQLAASSWGDIRINASITDYMNGYNDPRCAAYFTLSSQAGYTYVGIRMGQASNFNKTSGTPFSQPNFLASTKLPVFVAAETQFLLAEAVLRGWISGDAKEYYENGIRLSFEQWGAAGADAYIADETSIPDDHNDFLSQTYVRNTEVKINWDTESDNAGHLEQIITQKWIANFPMGIEAWAEYRRTGYPELCESVATNESNATIHSIRDYHRLRYPYTEADLNESNYNAAVAALGGDHESTPLFWQGKGI
ncbi:MAG: SusD/RagB family nutrient-binding outer membrane lipoprotein [Bacteroidetes bacterium]|uniref:SusD/RagB family nutrient-binding outer membrane lipoprotein n=1 Tax=Candidatus Cryptobacteroides merdavium TaxID=2840769 RepID=A0A9D9HCB3_9BACT|nr:SusD/RagB family nutrient-binding outer membrane lipoprotein [Candidatus Cryptobacteroides merdavium]